MSLLTTNITPALLKKYNDFLPAAISNRPVPELFFAAGMSSSAERLPLSLFPLRAQVYPYLG